MTSIGPTYRVSFAIGDERAAKEVVDVLTEIFFEGQAAISAFERTDKRWDVTVHFAEPPDQPLLRELVANAAGADIAAGIVFDTVEAKDWVKASLEDLVPVPAGRFVVHGQHDRDGSQPNKLGIEIEAALAFGTGHHGTTRGCLLLLDHVLKAWRPRRVLDLGTGTGVLAIAAAKALHEKVLASDIDPPSVQVARENARLNVSGHLVQAIRATGFAAPQFADRRAVRSGAGEYSRQSAAATGGADGAASGAIGAGDPVGPADASGARRHRRLSRPWAGAATAPAYRRLEQPVAAEGELKFLFGWSAGCGRYALSSSTRLTRASANRSSIWTMTPRCFLLATGGTGRGRPAAKSSQT